jgi:hypothetical protein
MKIGIVGNDCACVMAAVNRGQRARDRAAQPHAENCGGGPHRPPLTPKVEIIDGDYDALAGAIRKAGCDPPDPPDQLRAASAVYFPLTIHSDQSVNVGQTALTDH